MEICNPWSDLHGKEFATEPEKQVRWKWLTGSEQYSKHGAGRDVGQTHSLFQNQMKAGDPCNVPSVVYWCGEHPHILEVAAGLPQHKSKIGRVTERTWKMSSKSQGLLAISIHARR